MKKKETAIVFGKILRKLRKKRLLSQEKLSFISGIDRGYISMLELGNQSPSFDTALALCEALTMPFGHFASIFAENLKDFSEAPEKPEEAEAQKEQNKKAKNKK